MSWVNYICADVAFITITSHVRMLLPKVEGVRPALEMTAPGMESLLCS